MTPGRRSIFRAKNGKKKRTRAKGRTPSNKEEKNQERSGPWERIHAYKLEETKDAEYQGSVGENGEKLLLGIPNVGKYCRTGRRLNRWSLEDSNPKAGVTGWC